jgi:hypothetical protein
MQNKRTEEEEKMGAKESFFNKGQKSFAYKHFQLVPVNNSCSCFLQVK